MPPKIRKDLLNAKTGEYSNNHFNKLCETSREKCEFCDDSFPNRYRCLIHTAKHIIIPLIKHEIYQCRHCLFSFTSKEDLTSHKKVKHAEKYINDLMEQVVSNSVAIKCEKIDLSPLKDYGNEKEVELIEHCGVLSQNNIEKAIKASNNEVKKFVEIKLGNDMQNLFIQPTDIKKQSFTPVEVINNSEMQTQLQKLLNQPQQPMTNLQKIILNGISIKPIKKVAEVLPKPPKVQINHQMIVNNYSNRDEEFILPDLDPVHKICTKTVQPMALTKVRNNMPLPLKDPLVKTYARKPNTVTSSNLITIDSGVIEMNRLIEEKFRSLEPKFISVPYNELVKPGMFRCRRCGLTFPNKFDVITHETVAHFGLNKTRIRGLHCVVCDYYVAGNHFSLTKHIDAKHKNAKISRHFQICSKCNLKYTNKARHDNIYHHIPINITALMLPKVKKLKTIDECWFCDVCSMFIKNNKQCKYSTIGILQEYGKKYNCSNCCSMVDAVEVIKIFKYSYHGQRQNQDEQKESKLSNEVRLKNIQKRIMKMKK